jgi:hypothetical protein
VKIKNTLTFIYYSQMPLVLMAMVLTASISAVLTQAIPWTSVLLVGAATYFAYTLDNLIDWQRDKLHYQSIQNQIETYHRITYPILILTAVAIIYLILQSPEKLKIGLLLLGATTAMGIVRFSNYRSAHSESMNLVHFILNRLFITVIWTTVCVFLPLWNNDSTATPKTLRTALYIGQLIFSYAVLWKLEKSSPTLIGQILNSYWINVLEFLCLSAMTQVVLDVILQEFPLHNLLNLLPPLTSLLFLIKINKQPEKLRQKIGLLTLIMIFLTALSTVVHLILT